MRRREIELTYYAVEFSAADLGQILAMPAATVRVVWHRARRAGRLPDCLRSALDRKAPDFDRARIELRTLLPEEFAPPLAPHGNEADVDDCFANEREATPVTALNRRLRLKPTTDALLLRLNQAHRNDTRRAADIVPLPSCDLRRARANAARLRPLTHVATRSPAADVADDLAADLEFSPAPAAA